MDLPQTFVLRNLFVCVFQRNKTRLRCLELIWAFSVARAAFTWHPRTCASESMSMEGKGLEGVGEGGTGDCFAGEGG